MGMLFERQNAMLTREWRCIDGFQSTKGWSEEAAQGRRTRRSIQRAAEEDERDARAPVAGPTEHGREDHVGEYKDGADEPCACVAEAEAAVEAAVGSRRRLQLVEHGGDAPTVHVLEERDAEEQRRRRVPPARRRRPGRHAAAQRRRRIRAARRRRGRGTRGRGGDSQGGAWFRLVVDAGQALRLVSCHRKSCWQCIEWIENFVR